MFTIGDFSRLNAQRCPNKAAVLFHDRTLTYAALDVLSNRVAHALMARGLECGDRVAIMMFNCPEFVVVSQAVAKIGAILVPVNTRHATDEIAQLFRHCTPKLLFVEPDFYDIAAQAGARSVLVPLVKLDSAGLDEFCAGHSGALVERKVAPESAAAIMYTSGTTGSPKGIVVAHDKYLRIFHAVAIEMEVRERDIFQAVMPMFHNGGFASVLNPALMIGASVSCYGGRFEPERVLRDIERHKVTMTHLVPTMLDRVTSAAQAGDCDLSSLRKIHYGAMPMTAEILARARTVFDVQFFQGYGTTDAGLIARLTPEDHDLRPGMTGRPVFNTRSSIVDDDGKPVAVGEVGEVVVDGSTSGMIGYWHDEAQTGAVIRNGWIHTGDLARREADGFFTLVERRNFMIISGGENIYPSEVEKVLARHPLVREVAVFGVPDVNFGEAVCAAVVLAGQVSLSVQDVQQFCDGRLARYKFPRHLVILDELPRTATGKVAVGQLRGAALK